MKIDFTLIFSILLALGLVAFGFTSYQTWQERQKLRAELAQKTISAAEGYYADHLSALGRGRGIDSSAVNDSLFTEYGFAGVAVFHSVDSVQVLDVASREFVKASWNYVAQALSSDSSMGNFIRVADLALFEYIKVVKRKDLPELAVVFYSSENYISNIISDIRLKSFVRWFLQGALISGITLLIIRRSILAPLGKVVEWVKAARFGNVEKIKNRPPTEFLEPLYNEISGIAQAMQEAKAVAREEAQLRTAAEAVWTPERLREEMKQVLENKMMVVVSNREPYMHVHEGNRIKCIVPASGMVTAMEPILKACGGTWIASGSGDADRETVNEFDKVLVPPYEDKYTLRRVWLSKEQEQHFYYGFSNEGLWPLCHIAHTRPVFRKVDWDYYKKVNQLYANAVLDEIKNQEQPFVLVQDYHFALLPRLIKEARPDARVAIFWHIPWPNPESFGICPWQREILSGMLGADLIGFHTQYHCNNFLETVKNTLESRVIWESFSVRIGNYFTVIKPFPISIAFTLKDYEQPHVDQFGMTPAEVLKKHGLSATSIGIGVDRIDYTKGLIEKFLSVENFLEANPEYIGQFTFVQIGAPSRSLLKTYAELITSVEQEANRINLKYKFKSWQPILLLKAHHSHEEIMPYYRSANLCIVSSLHDGMNLVAKEFVASRTDNEGVLILSQFAGASQELHGALIVNPYNIDQCAKAIKTALEMPADQQQQKMKQMKRLIMRHNVYSWGASILGSMASIEN